MGAGMAVGNPVIRVLMVVAVVAVGGLLGLAAQPDRHPALPIES
jgi:hypothetical protein